MRVKNFVKIDLSHRFQDKCAFVFYVKIQDGRQKWLESDFCEKSLADSADNLQVRNFVEITILHHFRDKCAFVFYAKIQDGQQKCRESNFCKKLPVDSANTLQVINFIKISLFRTVFQINVFLCFTQKFKMAIENGRKVIFPNVASTLCRYPAGPKFCRNLQPFPR